MVGRKHMQPGQSVCMASGKEASIRSQDNTSGGGAKGTNRDSPSC